MFLFVLQKGSLSSGRLAGSTATRTGSRVINQGRRNGNDDEDGGGSFIIASLPTRWVILLHPNDARLGCQLQGKVICAYRAIGS
jgi:hypothetical protein